jgi:hypothetical protein
VVLDEAERGDEIAVRLVGVHGQAAGEYALVAARRVGLAGRGFWVVLGGGLFQHPSTLLEDAVLARIRDDAPAAAAIRAGLPSAGGAVLLALEHAGAPVDERLLARLRAGLPSGEFFVG